MKSDDWELLEPFWWLHPTYGAVQRIDGLWYGTRYNSDEMLGGHISREEACKLMEDLHRD